ncbi:MAG: YhfC family intramembrane metalloprotease, partial [Chloroflexi bacterium]|nr:YhfC family intramembrane metalloprotease [Chloroflexota bacterium]
QGFLPVPPVEYRLVFNAVLLGLTAGLCEEVARWLTYRFVLKSARAWKEALMVGAGHGGFEAMLIGAGSLVAFFAFSSALKADPSTLPAAAQAQLAAYWSQPDFLPLVGVLERVFAICTHLALSVLVLQAFTRRNNLYLAVAILAHAVVDATAVYAVATWGVIVTEGIVAVYAVAAVALILVLRPPATPSSPA